MIKLLSANVYLMCLVCSHAFTQNLNLDVNGSAIGANGVVRFNDPSLMGERVGAKIDYSDIGGNCFSDSKWSPAMVYLRNKSSIKFSQLKLNLYTGDLHYLNKSGVELVADSKIVDEIILFDKSDTIRIAFKLKKYVIDGKESFLLSLNNGSIILLKRTIVTLFRGEYDVSRARNDFRFVKKTDYFLGRDSQIYFLEKLDKESLSRLLPFREQNENWLKAKKNKLRTEADVVDFLDFVNASLN